jgi:nucleotide-binding universal stress UspA family protein
MRDEGTLSVVLKAGSFSPGSPKMRRVLVGLDRSEISRGLVEALPALRSWGVEELILAHAAPVSPVPLIHRRDGTQGVGDMLVRAHSRLAPPFRVVLAMGSGNIAEFLCAESRARAADAIVMGSSRRNRLLEAVAGSVVAEVIRLARVPILLFPHEAILNQRERGPLDPGSARVLVPTDFSPLAGRALARGAELAREDGLPLTLLHVIEGGGEGNRHEFHSRLESMASDLRAQGLGEVSVLMVEGEPWEEIVRLAHSRYDTLVVMGTQGRGWLPEVILGNQSREVVRHSRLPVLLVPDGEPRRADGHGHG